MISFGDSESTEIGSSVAAIGHPGGGGLWTLTTGTISSARNEGKRQIFQTDTAINPGNSGGPLLDGSASLIGLNTYVKRVNAKGMPLEGLNYSLRSSLASRWLHGLGVQVTSASVPAARAAAGAQTESTRAPSRLPLDKAARSYETRGGETAFGVPNIQFDLERTLGEVISRATLTARRSNQTCSSNRLFIVEVGEGRFGSFDDRLADGLRETLHAVDGLFELLDVEHHQRVVGAGVRNPGVPDLCTGE